MSQSDAVISPCGKYRYLLKRPCEVPHPERSTALFIMLNPSTADASIDDPTIRRCRGFAKSWECAGLTVANLYALRSPNPKDLWSSDIGPIGPDNNTWLERLVHEYNDVVCAWGTNAQQERVKWFYDMATSLSARLWCLGTTKSGAPRHPLYVKADQPLIPWELPNV